MRLRPVSRGHLVRAVRLPRGGVPPGGGGVPSRARCPFSRRRRKAGSVEGVGYGGLAAATLDACRALLADLPSYGARRDPPLRGGGTPAGRLGWRLAADLELVRTRGIRLFN